MSALKKPTPVSRLASPTPVSKIASPTTPALKSPTARTNTAASPASPSSSSSSTSSSLAATSSFSSTNSSSSSSSDDYVEYEGKSFSSMDDAERIQSLLPSSATNQNVSVSVRVRPLNSMERHTNQVIAWSVKDGIIFQTYMPETTSKSTPKPASHMYDHIFTDNTTNDQLYTRIGEPILNNCMLGYHGCIFAYGQTSSG